MADEYNLRNDIDNLTTRVDELDDDLKKCVRFSDENSTLQELDDNSLDYILNEYQDDSGGGSGGDADLSDYVKKSDVSVDVSLEDNGWVVFTVNIGDNE